MRRDAVDAIGWGERLRSRLGGDRLPRLIAPSEIGPAPELTPSWRLVLRALFEMGGFDRGVLYDLPPEAAPRSMPGSRVFLRGSPAWRRFLMAREQVDDGMLTLLLALRSLPDGERRLVVDWGNSFANAFMLVEPRDPTCDLTDPAHAARRALEDAAGFLLRGHGPDEESARAWTRDTSLGALVRQTFGVWRVWTGTARGATVDCVPLELAKPQDTLRDRLLPAMAARFPQALFDDALAGLYERERELFGGPVVRARIPFLTRLGLPVPYDPRRVDYALRRMVNEGRAWVFEQGPDPPFYHGPQRPVPERMTDAEFERLVLR